MPLRARHCFRPAVTRLDDRCLLAGLTPAQVTTAYGLSAIAFKSGGMTIKGDGSGQTIAVIDAYHDPNLASDLAVFDARYGLPAPKLMQVNLAGSAANNGWASEETLDAEWAHAMAPGASLVVVEAASSNTNSLLAAVKAARAIAGVSVISMSWTETEFSGENRDDRVFTTPPGHTGITYVAASGDYGRGGGAQWPASSPNVVGVGGTTLFVSGRGTYLRESSWTGSSGGISQHEAEPSFQKRLHLAGRSTPDVAFDGNPNTGVAVYTTDPVTGVGSWQQVGGTSFGTPAWGAIFAIVDQGRTLDGAGTLKSGSQTLAALYSLPAGDFHKAADVASGFHAIGQPATLPGLGTPNGEALVAGLVSFTSAKVETRADARLR
jgi:subtilase family serine protease